MLWSFILCGNILSNTVRRRARRQRALARRDLWEHRRGTRVLSPLRIRTLLQRLAQHHSRDPTVLQRLRKVVRPMAKTMKQAKPPPWRCRFCVMVRSGVDDSCPDCWRHWTIADDPTFTPPKPRSQPSQDPDKNSDPSPWTSGPSTAATPWIPDVKKESQDTPMNSALLAAIKKSYPDITKAPADIRAEVEKAERLAGKTKENVGEECDAARDQLLAVMDAREQHRLRWLKHLEASALSWQTQMASYEKQKKQYQEMVDEAKARHDAARTALDAMNEKLGEGDANATQIDPVEAEVHGVTEAELRKNVHQTLRRCLRSVSEDAPVEISDGEDAEIGDAQPNKRVRSDNGS